MEKIKLIEKEVNPRDARMSLVKLSAAGKQLFEDASVTFEYAARTILQPLSENQVTRLCEYTTKLL